MPAKLTLDILFKEIENIIKRLEILEESTLQILDLLESSVKKESTLPRQYLTNEQRLEIIKSIEPVHKLAVKYNRSRQQIYNIRNGK